MSREHILRHYPESDRYEVEIQPGQWAILSYSKHGDIVFINHTEVPASLRGRGSGALLMERVLTELAQQGLKVRPYM